VLRPIGLLSHQAVSVRQTVDSRTDSAACRIVEVAKQLALQVELTSPIPPDYDPSELWWPQIRAEIRHEFTNYDQLLRELPMCVDHRDEAGECVWDLERDLECPLERQAHDIIKWAANRVASAEFERSQNTRQTYRGSGEDGS
jgi:hypothetical protein